MKIRLNIEHLKNPIIAEFILSKIGQLREVDAEELQDYEQIFNDITISELIKHGDQEILSYMFHNLQAEHFAHFIDDLYQNLPVWEDNLALSAAPIIAQLNPDKFLSLCAQFKGRMNFNVTFGLLQGFQHISPAQGKEEFENLADRIFNIDDQFYKFAIGSLLLPLAYKYKLHNWSNMLIDLMQIAGQDVKRLSVVFASLYKEITGDLPYLSLIWNIRDKNSSTKFEDCLVFFRDNTPLSQFDTILSKSKRTYVKSVQTLFQGNLFAQDITTIPETTYLMDEALKTQNKIYALLLADFVFALFVSQFAREIDSFDGFDLDKIINIAGIDLPWLPGYDAILTYLKKALDKEVTKKMIRALNKSNTIYGDTNLVSLMGDLGYEAFIPKLIDCTSNEYLDLLCERATFSLKQIGKKSEAIIIERWDQLDFSQRIFCSSVLELIGGDQTQKLLLNEAGEIENLTEDWFCLAQNVPNLKLIKIMESELRRKQSYIDRAFIISCNTLNLKRPLLKTAEKRELIRDKKAIDSLKAFQDNDLENIVSEDISLELKCKQCGAQNTYMIKKVFFNNKSKDEQDIIIPEDLKCLSCDQYTELDLTPKANLALAAEMMKIGFAENMGKEYSGPLSFVTPAILGGKKVTFKEAFSYYQDKLDKNPDDVKTILGFANTNNNLGKVRKSIELYFRCLEVDANCVEASYKLAHIAFVEDLFQEALSILSTALENRSNWKFYHLNKLSRNDFEKKFFNLYDEIKIISNMDTEFPRISTKKDRKKVGRNEPCPCGSGKKYKHCCGKL